MLKLGGGQYSLIGFWYENEILMWYNEWKIISGKKYEIIIIIIKA